MKGLDLSAPPSQERQDFDRYYELIKSESDRGGVLIAASLLENILETKISERLVPSTQRKDPLLHGANAPLGNFSSKIEAAYRLGIIWKEMRDLLSLFRRLRNDFAHSPTTANLESPQNRDRLTALFQKDPILHDFIIESLARAATKIVPEKLDELEVTPEEYIKKHFPVRQMFNYVFSGIVTLLDNFPAYPDRIEAQSITKTDE